jgi:hypothetical protein
MVNHVAVFEKAISQGHPTTTAATPKAVVGPDNKKKPAALHRRPKASIPFIRGPIPLRWLAEASALSRSAARLSVAIWYRLGLTGQHVDLTAPDKTQPVVRIDGKLREECRLKRWHVSDGIRDLADAGLIRIVKAGRGRCPTVAVTVQRDARQATQAG